MKRNTRKQPSKHVQKVRPAITKPLTDQERCERARQTMMKALGMK